jgi:hypothetical protein
MTNNPLSDPIVIDENKLYFFTSLSLNRYYTVFAGWLRSDLIKAFEKIEEGQSYAHIRLNVGEHLFINNIGAPLYLLNYENDDIYQFAGDDQELNLFPSGNIPAGLEMDPTIDFPTYFTREVEPLIEFKLFNQFYAQRNGEWVQLKI